MKASLVRGIVHLPRMLFFILILLLPSLPFAQNLKERSQAKLDEGLEAFQAGELEKAWDIWAEGYKDLEDKSDLDSLLDLKATFLDLLGVVADASGDLVSAIEYMEEALEMRESMPGENFADIGYCNNNLGAAYFMLADWDLAIDYYQESQLNYFLSEDSLEAAWPMTNSGLAHLRSENFPAALKAFAEAEPWVLRSEDASLRRTLYTNWGLAEIQTGNWLAAQAHLKAVLAEMPKDSKAARGAAANLGFGFLKQGDPETAQIWLQQALSEGSSALANHQQAKVMLHLSQTWMSLGKPAEALALSSQGISLLADTTIPTDQALPGSLTGTYDRRTMLQLTFERCKALVELGQLDRAKQDLRSLFTILDELRSQMQVDESRLFFSGFAQPIHQFALQAAWKGQQLGQPSDLDFVFGCFLRNKALLLRENQEKARAMQMLDAPEDLSRLYLGAKRMLAHLDQKIESSKRKGGKDLGNLEHQHYNLAKKLRKLEKEMGDYVGELSASKGLDYSIESAKAWVQGNATPILAYFVGPDEVFGFQLGINAKAGWAHLGSRDTMELHARRFLRACKDWDYVFTWPDSAASDIREEGHWLFQHLVQPLLGAQMPAQLQIIPDGILSLIPFEAMLTQAPPSNVGLSQFPWFIRSTSLSYNVQAPELQAIRELANPLGKMPPYALVMAPFAKGGPDDSLALPGSLDEVNAVAEHIHTSRLIGDDATWEALATRRNSRGYLHLALHGRDDLDSSGQGYLIFGGGEKVEAWRIANHRFPVDLVFLSACETGSGTVAKGEGVLSLSRSFLEAGANSVVMSLWRLEDAKSSRIVGDFYEGLALKMDFQHALQFAKLRYLDQADDFSAMPAFWAPLVLNGQVQVLEEDPIDVKFYLLMGLGIIVLIVTPFIVKQMRKFLN